MPYFVYDRFCRIERHGCYMHNGCWFHLQPHDWNILILHCHLTRALSRCAVNPVPLPIGLIHHPVAHGRSFDIDHALGRYTEGVEHGWKVVWKILSTTCYYTDARLPESHSKCSIQTIASHAGHLSRAIWQNHVVDCQISYYDHSWSSFRAYRHPTLPFRFQLHVLFPILVEFHGKPD